jgi:hypothetical protein
MDHEEAMREIGQQYSKVSIAVVFLKLAISHLTVKSKMKNILIICIVFIDSIALYSQTISCVNKLDSSDVFVIANRHRPYLNRSRALPKISYDGQSCTWTSITASKMKFTNSRFRTWKTITLVIDDKTGKILSRKKNKHKVPSYE